MTNLFKRLFKSKSKFLLIILCLLGLAFSYSCSCRNESTGPKWEDDDKKVDPKVFTISTNSVETRLVQKASDTSGKSFTYQPSIKFSEANNNAYTVDASTEDATFKSKLKYDEKTGLISLTDYTDLATEKKTITITFTVKANDTTLQNPETNFTLDVGLKKTAGVIDTKEHIGKIFKQVYSFNPTGFPFSVRFEKEPTSTEITANTAGTDDGKNKGEVKFNKNNFITSLKSNLEETAQKHGQSKITYKKMELINDEKSSNDTWGFNFKFIFSDEDYDLTEEQKTDGVKFRLDIKIGDKDNPVDGTYVTWI